MTETAVETVAHIFQDMENGDPIKAVEGIITQIYEPMQAGQGTLQNGKIRDDEGSEGKITFSDTSINHKTTKGRRIRIESVNGPRGRTGLKVKDSDQYGRAIWVTGSAHIAYPDGQGPETEAPKKTNFKPGGGVKKSEPTKQGPSRSGTRTPAQRLEDLGDLLAACCEQVKSKTMKNFLVEESDPANIASVQQALTSTLFIECDKQGLASAWITRDEKQLPPIPTDSTKWREAYINSKGSEMYGKSLAEISDQQLGKLFSFYDDSKSNTPFAECVYKATEERGLLPTKDKEPEQPEFHEDDEPEVPF